MERVKNELIELLACSIFSGWVTGGNGCSSDGTVLLGNPLDEDDKTGVMLSYWTGSLFDVGNNCCCLKRDDITFCCKEASTSAMLTAGNGWTVTTLAPGDLLWEARPPVVDGTPCAFNNGDCEVWLIGCWVQGRIPPERGEGAKFKGRAVTVPPLNDVGDWVGEESDWDTATEDIKGEESCCCWSCWMVERAAATEAGFCELTSAAAARAKGELAEIVEDVPLLCSLKRGVSRVAAALAERCDVGVDVWGGTGATTAGNEVAIGDWGTALFNNDIWAISVFKK